MNQIVLSQEDIQRITSDLGFKLTKEVENDEKTPVFVGVMKGALNFMMDLVKNVTCPIYTDFIQISSYQGTATSGSITLTKDITRNCEGRTVVIIEDIIDTGLSMHFLIQHVLALHPKRVIVVALFDKVLARKIDVQIDYAGCVLKDNKFLLGYGLDYNELCRNIPYVYAADEKEIERLNDINQNK